MAVNNDVPVQIHPDVPDDQKWALVNENFQKLANNLNPLMVSDGSNIRIIVGKLSDGSYGFVVSKSGYDAYTAVSS